MSYSTKIERPDHSLSCETGSDRHILSYNQGTLARQRQDLISNQALLILGIKQPLPANKLKDKMLTCRHERHERCL